jgi:chloramphenicol 3-O phosphotransferase
MGDIPKRGRIVLLNGASSSGKSTIAKCLQEILDEPYLHVCHDDFKLQYYESFPKKYRPPPLPSDISDEDRYALRDKSEFWNRRYSAFYHYIAILSKMETNVIVDIVMATRHVLKMCIGILVDYPLLLVGVHCPLQELEERESKRKHRVQGLAKKQYERVHAHAMYDIEIDTSQNTPLQCAQEIKDSLVNFPKEVSSRATKKLYDFLFK